MEIVNTEHMHLELSIFERDVMKIKKGQPVYFRLPEANSKQFTGDIHLIGKSINEDRTVKVHAHIDESQQEGMVPGMYAQATIITDQVKWPALDSRAFFESPEGSGVFLLVSEKEGKFVFERKALEPGEADSEMTRVLNESDFEPGARFLRNSNDMPLEELLE
jgi:cobalt-zinc-cadmium efflux system membrane fusion protein